MHHSYQSEKFSQARCALMLPHTQGEAASIAEAFYECSLALDQFDKASLESTAADWVSKLELLMSIDGVTAKADEGLYHAKAQTFTTHQKIEISRLIDELANWFAASE
jgi:hypothetical protein